VTGTGNGPCGLDKLADERAREQRPASAFAALADLVGALQAAHQPPVAIDRLMEVDHLRLAVDLVRVHGEQLRRSAARQHRRPARAAVPRVDVGDERANLRRRDGTPLHRTALGIKPRISGPHAQASGRVGVDELDVDRVAQQRRQRRERPVDRALGQPPPEQRVLSLAQIRAPQLVQRHITALRQQRQQVVADPLAVGRLRARVAREALRPQLQKLQQRRGPRLASPVAVEPRHQPGRVRHRVALALEAPGLADHAIQTDIARPPQPALSITHRLAHARHPDRLACPIIQGRPRNPIVDGHAG